jgi:predicted metal-dependent peptidase
MIDKVTLATNLRATKIFLMHKAPFFGALFYGTTISINEEEERPSCAWTDGETIYFNLQQLNTLLEDSFMAMKEKEVNKEHFIFECITFLAIHELMHCMFLHLERKGAREALIWNCAADVTINTLIDQWFPSLRSPKGLLTASSFNLNNVRNKTTETVYDELLNKGVDPSRMTMLDLQEDLEKNSQDLKDEWQKKMEQAKAQCSGNIQPRDARPISGRTDSLIDLLDEVYEPKVNWRELIDHLGGEIAKGDFSFRRQSKNSIGTNYYLPSMHTYEPFVVVAIDTSGSISKMEYVRFMSEVRGILSLHNCKVGLLQCDTSITSYVELSTGDALPPVKGGGGTRFKPVFEYLNSINRSIEALLYFTDGYNFDSGFEKALAVNHQVVWVMTTGVTAPEIGRSLRYDPYT